MGGEKKKQFLLLGGVPLIVHTLEIFQSNSLITEIILLIPNNEIDYCKKEIVSCNRFTKLKKIVSGGEKRQDSVFNGLKWVSPEIDIIVVHDGVRPFLTKELLETTITEAQKKGAAIVAIPIKDTLKEISGQGIVGKGINRDLLWRIQTPQAFKKEIIVRAFEKAGQDNFYATDESTLVTRLGAPVYVVSGSELNIKITTPEDLILGESILQSLQKSK